jgi:hypothetical protein
MVVFFFPLIALFGFTLLKLQFNRIYGRAIQEDNILEYLQSVFYFVAAVFAALVVRRFFVTKRHFLGLLYSILCLAFLFVCLEEVSWGQRLLDFEGTAYIREHNIQNEFSLHNLSLVQPIIKYMYILVSGLGAFAWLVVPKRTQAKYKSTAGFVIPDRILFFYFFPAFVIYVYLTWLMVSAKLYWIDFRSTFDYFVTWRDQEPAELLLSLGFLLFVAMARKNEAVTFAEDQTAQKLEPNSISDRRGR